MSNKRAPFWTRLVLTIVALATALTPVAAMASGPTQAFRANYAKLDPALVQRMGQAAAGEMIPVIVRPQSPAEAHANPHGNARRAAQALEHIRNAGGRAGNTLAIVSAASGELSAAQIARLSRSPFVGYIWLDDEVTLSGPMGAPLAGLYPEIVRAPEVWSMGITGRGVTVAIIDSGVAAVDEFRYPQNRIVASVDLTVNGDDTPKDPGGHGTHVAGIVAGSGSQSDGAYKGIAPGANLAMIRVIKSNGKASMSTVLRGIQWAVQNRQTYNIRVMNLSLGAKKTTSYHLDLMSAAVESAWFSGIVVVAAAGNHGPNVASVSSPGIDPYIITVGAIDDNRTLALSDDSVPYFSGRGPTPDLLPKPDLVAPGRMIVSLRALNSFLDNSLPDRRTATNYFRLTGTSMATPVVAGTVALMLEKNPSLTPNQVKAILKATARPLVYGDANSVGAGLVDAYAAVNSPLRAPANRGLQPSDALAADLLPLVRGAPLVWKDPYYMGINWANVTWDNVTWDNVTWDNITWDNVTWDNVTWDSNVTWDNVTWDNVTWDSNVSWDSVDGASAEEESHGWESLEELD